MVNCGRRRWQYYVTCPPGGTVPGDMVLRLLRFRAALTLSLGAYGLLTAPIACRVAAITAFRFSLPLAAV